MKSSKKARNALLFSVVSIALCVAMLIGATFAWFTDTVTNTGNVITAGNLSISAEAYSVDAGGDKEYTIPGVNGDKPIKFATNGQDLKAVAAPLIAEKQWEPGQSDAKLLEVTNNGNLAATIQLRFNVKDGGLQNALWFDFVQVGDGSSVTGTFTRRDMSTLATFAQDMNFPLGKGQTVRFVLLYGMKESADNRFMGKSFSADVVIQATQAPVEEDGFGNSDYDADAVKELPDVYVSDPKGLPDAIENAQDGDIIALAANTEFGDGSTINIDKDLTLVGEGGTKLHAQITTNNASGEKSTLTVENLEFVGGEGDVGTGVTKDGSIINDEGLSAITIKNCKINYGSYQFLRGGKEDNGWRSIKYTIVDNVFVSTVPSNDAYEPINTLGSWADGSVISGNTFGSESNRVYNWAFRPMNVDNGATITVSDNKVYALGCAFAFYTRSDRATDYKVIFENNTANVDNILDHAQMTDDQRFLFMARNKNGATMHATVVFKGNNTLNGKLVNSMDNIVNKDIYDPDTTNRKDMDITVKYEP